MWAARIHPSEDKKGRVMPRNTDYDDFDDDEDEVEQPRRLEGEALVKHLRKQIKERDKKLSDVETKLNDFLKRERRTTVEDVLKGAQVNPKYARWVVRDLDDQEPTKEAVEKWLEENADLVGIQRDETTVDEDTQDNLKRIQGADKGAKGADADPIAAKLSDPNLSPEDLESLIGKSLRA